MPGRSQLRVALTGGVGAGKSTLGAALERLGAVRIDADAIARDVLATGSPGARAVVDRFGSEMTHRDGGVDRAALARLVFADGQARSDLNAIVHPLVQERSAELMAAAPPGAVVVYEIPLLVETGRAADFDVVIVVESELDRRVRRLVARGLDERDARARIAAQATDEQRRAIADEIVGNDGSTEKLSAIAQALWNRLQTMLDRRSGEG